MFTGTMALHLHIVGRVRLASSVVKQTERLQFWSPCDRWWNTESHHSLGLQTDKDMDEDSPYSFGRLSEFDELVGSYREF